MSYTNWDVNQPRTGAAPGGSGSTKATGQAIDAKR